MPALRLRKGFVLVAVLYFLVVTALTIAALFFVRRSISRGAYSMALGAQLLGAAEEAAYEELAGWDGATRERQRIGTTTHSFSTSSGPVVDVYVTRLAMRIFSLVTDARTAAGVARRVELLVRVPFTEPPLPAALLSAVNVSVGSGVRFSADTGLCGASPTDIVLSPRAALSIDATSNRPSTRTDSLASDSASYLRLSDAWWSGLTLGADVRLPSDAHVSLAPTVGRAPVMFAPGDLTIDGGVGQGVLLVDGHLVIAGPLTFSGQIVARHGIEMRADDITISGIVAAWRASVDTTATDATSNEVMLTGATTLRYSGCDARHGIASWLEPRRVRERAFAELF